MIRELGKFLLVWTLVLLLIPFLLGYWRWELWVLFFALLTAAVQLPLLYAAYGLAWVWPRVRYRVALAVLVVAEAVALFAWCGSWLYSVPLGLCFSLYLAVATGPTAAWERRKRVADPCPVCGGPTALARVAAGRVEEGGLRAVHLCTPHAHASWRSVDGHGPLRALA